MSNMMPKIAFALATMAAGPVVAQDAVPAPTPTPNAAAAPVELTAKEQALMPKCKLMTAAQIAQSSKCTALIKKVGGTVQSQNMDEVRQQMGR